MATRNTSSSRAKQSNDSKSPKTASNLPAKAAKPLNVAVGNPLFVARPRSQRVGGNIRPSVDVSRFVRWPKYVRLQRQKKILLQRLKVPPALNQLNRTLDKNQAAEVFKLLLKYQPESAEAKSLRIENAAKAVAAGESVASATAAPAVLKFGLKHVTSLIEQKKAKLVLIAHDVDPVELIVWLPALCRKMDVPFAIIKGKSRLGALTHLKTCAVCALTNVHPEDSNKLKSLQENFKAQFNDVVERKWGGGVMGLKTQAKLALRKIQIENEESKKRNVNSRI